jgi:hypothetical protein
VTAHKLPGAKLLHRFRTPVLAMTIYEGRLIVLTEAGAYRFSKSMKSVRKIKPLPLSS